MTPINRDTAERIRTVTPHKEPVRLTAGKIQTSIKKLLKIRKDKSSC